MKHTLPSERQLDRQIEATEAKLAELRKKKLSYLESRMKEAERALIQMKSNLGGGGSGSAVRAGKRSSRGGPRGPRMNDQEVLERLTKEVKTAGADGISARSAAERSGVFYLRAIKVMDANFKKSGVAKWTRYRL